MQQISHGQLTAKKFSRYDLEGYRFRTAKLEETRPLAATTNSGVVATSHNASGGYDDYYGVLQDITEYTFGGRKPLKLVTFQCVWFDPIAGTRVLDKLGIVEVKHASRYKGNEYNNIVFAHQVKQVYYLSYPHPSLKAWWVVFKVPPEVHPNRYDEYNRSTEDDDIVEVYQEDNEEENEDFTVSDGIGLVHELASLVGELLVDEPGPSTTTTRKSNRLSEREEEQIEREKRLNRRVAEEDSDAEDF